MRRRPCLLLFPVLACLALLVGAVGQTTNSNQQTKRTKPATARSSATPQSRESTSRTSPNLAKQRTLYVVGYAHLDTQWRWEYPQVIQEYLPKTMRNNFALFELSLIH